VLKGLEKLQKKELQVKRIEKPKIVIPKPVVKQNPATCYSLGDPHYRTFTNKYYNNYWVGDWVLIDSRHFTVHARTRKWGNAAVNKRIAANLNGDIVEAKSSDKFKLNKDTVITLKVGQKFRLPNGGIVHRISSNRTVYYSFEHGYVDAEYIGSGSTRYVNLIVNVPNFKVTSGACDGSMVAAKGLFHHTVEVRERKKSIAIRKSCHDNARKKCKAKGIQKRYLGSCIIDVCSGLGTAGLRKGVRHFKQDK